MSGDRFAEPKDAKNKHEDSNISVYYDQVMRDIAQNRPLNGVKPESDQKPPSSDHLPGLHITEDKQAAPKKPEHQGNGFESGLLKTLTIMQPHSNEPVHHWEMFKSSPLTKALAEGAAAGAGLWNMQQNFIEAQAKVHK